VTALLLMLAMAAEQPPALSQPSPSALLDQLENQREWSEADRGRAVELAKFLRGEWSLCLMTVEERLRRSTEAVETVVTAVLGGCLTEERVYQRSYATALRGLADPVARSSQAREGVATIRAGTREEIISRLVNDRLAPQKAR
jgi:hypothetical protein